MSVCTVALNVVFVGLEVECTYCKSLLTNKCNAV